MDPHRYMSPSIARRPSNSTGAFFFAVEALYWEAGPGRSVVVEKVTKSEREWRASLSAEQFAILRQAGTERPFSGEYCDTKDAGTYVCAGCGTSLFTSQDKFDSGCGWPSFSSASEHESVTEHSDSSHGMVRTEIRCAACEGHLGHVFPDGPQPTGLRYCVNSLSLHLETED
jgi:peptide-methionine (R)-S-oxide reductase